MTATTKKKVEPNWESEDFIIQVNVRNPRLYITRSDGTSVVIALSDGKCDELIKLGLPTAS